MIRSPGALIGQALVWACVALPLIRPAWAHAEATAPGVWPKDEGQLLAQQVERIQKTYAVHSQIAPVATPIAPPLADFLLDHPDLSAEVVRKHRLAPYRIEMRGVSRSNVDDGAGIRGVVTLVEKRPDRRVYIAEGVYANRLLPEVHAEAVIIMKTSPVERRGCPPGIRTEFDVYVALPNRLLAHVVRALRRLLRKTIARKFSRAILVAHNTALLLAKDPEGMGKELLAFPQFRDEDRATAKRELGRLKSQPPACLESAPPE